MKALHRLRSRLFAPIALLAAVALVIAAGLLALPGVANAADPLISQGKATTASSTESAGTRPQRRRRQRRHPLVVRVQRSTVDPGRPRRDRDRHPGRAELGGRVRADLPDPDLRRRRPVRGPTIFSTTTGTGGDPDDPGHRLRPVRPDERHRPGHGVRLLAVGVPGLRHVRRDHPAGRLRHHNAALNHAVDRVLDRERRHPGAAPPSTATPPPAGPAPSADPQWLQVDLGAPRPSARSG